MPSSDSLYSRCIEMDLPRFFWKAKDGSYSLPLDLTSYTLTGKTVARGVGITSPWASSSTTTLPYLTVAFASV